MYSVKYYKKQNIKQINDKCGLLHVSTHLIEFILSSSASFDLNNTARIAYLFCIPLFTLLHLWEFVNTIFYVYQIPLSVDGPHMCVCVCVYIYIYMYMYIYIYIYIQGGPLATEPVISLIILTPMKILQRNLNRNKFVV